MNVTVAGLDLSLRAAGVAILHGDGTPEFHTFGYQLTKEATNRDILERVIHITNSIMGVLKKANTKYVGIENYGFASKGKIAMQADLGGTVKTQIYIGLKTVPILIPAMSVRKYLLGKATKDKKVVRAYLESIGYTQMKTLDECDAMAIALVVNDWANKQNEIVDVEKMETLDRINLHQTSGRCYEQRA